MQLITTKKALFEVVANAKSTGKTIGFVPTMGALHNGHLTLVKRCVSENDLCFVSVFVNPTQFNDKNDLANYPRTLEADAELLASVGCQFVFAPNADEMYDAEEMQKPFEFDFGGLDEVMEGRFRPGHFNGVVQVVSKLFQLVQPTRAYFGEKDFQQLAIIRKLVKNLKININIHGVPTYREDSGLAMSSRNERLSSEQKKAAVIIHQTLVKVNDWFRIITIPEIYARVNEIFEKQPGMVMEYFKIADEETLKETDFFYKDRQYRAFIVVFVGEVRLIDNMHLD